MTCVDYYRSPFYLCIIILGRLKSNESDLSVIMSGRQVGFTRNVSLPEFTFRLLLFAFFLRAKFVWFACSTKWCIWANKHIICSIITFAFAKVFFFFFISLFLAVLAVAIRKWREKVLLVFFFFCWCKLQKENHFFFCYNDSNYVDCLLMPLDSNHLFLSLLCQSQSCSWAKPPQLFLHTPTFKSFHKN